MDLIHKKTSFSLHIPFSRIMLLLVLVVLPLFPMRVPTAHAQDVTSAPSLDFARVGNHAGWLQTNGVLYGTQDDGSTWTNITPAGLDGAEMASIFFLNEMEGWLVASTHLFHTADGGTTWQSSPLDLFTTDEWGMLSGAVTMQWLNSNTGWILFKLATGVNFSQGFLFKTTDGGASWTRLTAPMGEPFVFTSEMTGWMAGGPDGSRLFRTTDGGVTWTDAAADVPTDDADARVYFHLPKVAAGDANRGLLPVLRQSSGQTGVLWMYATEDGGATWVPQQRDTLMQEVNGQTPLFLNMLDEQHYSLLLPGEDRLFRVGEFTAESQVNLDGLTQVSMADLSLGWGKQTEGNCQSEAGSVQCVTTTRLLRTEDGGVTWQPLTLPDGSAEITRSMNSVRETRSSAADAGILGVYNTQTFIGQGFDKCEIPSLSSMQTWWSASPYKIVNLYIGGSLRGCDNTALNAAYIKQLNAQGWKFIPTWVGPQPPCSMYVSNSFSYNTTTAYNQGVDEAKKAATALVNLELTFANTTGSVVYYDLEPFPKYDNCTAATRAFLNGWTAQLHSRGHLSGLYGSTYGSHLSDYLDLPNRLDVLWAAVWEHSDPAERAYDPNASVYGLPYLSDSVYNNHQRIRQYEGDHDETWGEISLGGIDSDVLDGVVALFNDHCPSIRSLTPNIVLTGSPAFTLTVKGTNFVSGSKVRLNGVDVSTTYQSASQLTATVANTVLSSQRLVSVTATSTTTGCQPSNAAMLGVFDTILKTYMPVIYR